MISLELSGLAQKVVSLYTTEQRKIVTAESCTGGLVCSALTGIDGSSAAFERGFITYSNDAKVEVLGVRAETIERYGAVSERVAEEMAQGALDFSRADVALAVTGIAGPSGGSAEKPVGLVYFGVADRVGTLLHYKCQFNGDRQSIRGQAVKEALNLLVSLRET